jgi:nucleotide-binding universal stress UspA family protein
MFKHIMVPVDLAHTESLGHALDTAADLAAHWGAKVTYVGVGTATPGKLAHNPAEFSEKLNAFAKAQAVAHAIDAKAHAAIAHDPTTDVDDVLLHTIDEIGADLVVMQSHIPGLVDYIWPSNGGKIAGHSRASVLVVRG